MLLLLFYFDLCCFCSSCVVMLEGFSLLFLFTVFLFSFVKSCVWLVLGSGIVYHTGVFVGGCCCLGVGLRDWGVAGALLGGLATGAAGVFVGGCSPIST